MTISYHGGNIIRGTAADRTGGTWTNLQSGYLFIESDTQLIYYWNGTAWAASTGEKQEFGSYLIYIAGSNKKRMNLATKTVEDTNTDASTVINAALTALPATSGSRLLLNTGFYSLVTTITPPSYCHISGEAQFGISQLRPTTDIPAIEISAKTNVILDNLYLSHNQGAYTSSLLNLKGSGATSTAACNFNGLAFYDFGTLKGNAIGMDSTAGSVYRNRYFNCLIQGFDSCIAGNVPNTTYFITNNRFNGCNFINMKRILKVTSVSSAAFDDNSFSDCEGQASASTVSGFDYETGHSGHSFYSVHDNCLIQDLPGGTNYALINTTSDLSLLGCYPAWKIGGAGAASGKIRSLDVFTVNRNVSTQSGNASTKVFNIAHSLAAIPKTARVSPGSTDALGGYTVTFDATNVIVTYQVAPPSGTNNLIWNWEANVF